MRDFHALRVADFRVHPIRRTRLLVAKNQTVFICITSHPKRLRGMRGEKPQSLGRRRTGFERGPIRVMMHVERIPIIHARALQVFVGHFKTQRVNQVQPAPRHGAHPANIAGVLWYLRLEENDVKHDV